MSKDIILPAIGSKGKFTFKPPFDTIKNQDIEYEVISIRGIKEIIDSEEDPYTNIYEPVEIPESEYEEDVKENIPIVILRHGNNLYTYIPADRLGPIPDISGVRYQEKILAITLGYLPVEYDLDTVKDTIVDNVLSVTGITSTVEAVPTSTIAIIAEEKHLAYMKLLKNKIKYNESTVSKLHKANLEYDLLKKKYDHLEKYIVNTICPLIDAGQINNTLTKPPEDDVVEEEIVEDLEDTNADLDV